MYIFAVQASHRKYDWPCHFEVNRSKVKVTPNCPILHQLLNQEELQ